MQVVASALEQREELFAEFCKLSALVLRIYSVLTEVAVLICNWSDCGPCGGCGGGGSLFRDHFLQFSAFFS